MSDLADTPGPRPDAPPAAAGFERAISPIAGRLGADRAGKALAFAGLVAGCGVFVAASWGHDKPKADRAPDQPARQVVPFEPLQSAAPTLASPGAAAPRLTRDSGPQPDVPAPQPAPSAASGADAAAQRQAALAAMRGAPILAYSGQTNRSEAVDTSAGTVPAVGTAEPAAATELDQLRRGSAIGRARASRLPDRNFLIVAGAAIPCLLQTAMDTATPGYVTCLIPRDVYSDNGAVVLMEKGTKVLGEYRSSMRQGQRRLFALWTRAVTPSGVAISLASPAADALGRAGFDGAIDTHFWERFGGAVLLSIIDDGAYAVAGTDGASGVARLPSDAAGIAPQNSINIPPSLRKAHGAEVSIFVAQDFDFSGVYGLQAR